MGYSFVCIAVERGTEHVVSHETAVVITNPYAVWKYQRCVWNRLVMSRNINPSWKILAFLHISLLLLWNKYFYVKHITDLIAYTVTLRESYAYGTKEFLDKTFLFHMKNVSLCDDQCCPSQPADCPAWRKKISVAIFSDSIKVIIVKLFIVVLFIKLYLFKPLSVTLTIFQDHRIKHF